MNLMEKYLEKLILAYLEMWNNISYYFGYKEIDYLFSSVPDLFFILWCLGQY